MMSEKFKLIQIDDYVFQIHDIDNDLYLVAEQICNLLNEQDEKIKEIETENEQLRKELDCFHPVMFQDMRRGTVVLYLKELK